jgi:hypothetical protein
MPAEIRLQPNIPLPEEKTMNLYDVWSPTRQIAHDLALRLAQEMAVEQPEAVIEYRGKIVEMYKGHRRTYSGHFYEQKLKALPAPEAPNAR